MNDLLRKILEDKRTTRQLRRELPFSEKIKILEKLRERSLAIAKNPLQRQVTAGLLSGPAASPLEQRPADLHYRSALQPLPKR